jgi:hypothetical protein
MIVTQMSIFKNRIGPALLLILLPYGKFKPLGSAIHQAMPPRILAAAKA